MVSFPQAPSHPQAVKKEKRALFIDEASDSSDSDGPRPGHLRVAYGREKKRRRKAEKKAALLQKQLQNRRLSQAEDDALASVS